MFKDFQQLTIKIVDLVNSPRKTQRIIRDATVPRMILKDFVESLKAMDAKGFLLGSCSEVSMRAKGGKLLITPQSLPMCRVAEEALLSSAIKPDIMNDRAGFPGHIDWHRAIYLKSKANAIVLCQPVFTCIVSRNQQRPEKNILTEGAKIIDSINSVEESDVRSLMGTDWGDEGILLIRSVGVLAWGRSLDEVFGRIELLERICEIQVKST